MQRVLNNLGIGVGGVIGGLIATTAQGQAHLAALRDRRDHVRRLPGRAPGSSPSPPRIVRPDDAPRGRLPPLSSVTAPSWRTSVMNAALIGVGFSLLGDIFPAFAKNTAGVSERGIGLCFLANTLVIVIAQLPVAKWLEGRRRMAAYGVEGALWAVAWLIVFAGGWWLTGSAAAVVFAAALTVFGFGECFHGTVQNALVADLSKPGLLGRYLALNGFAFQLGGAAGRAAGGFALALAPHGLWLLAAAAAFAGGTSALFLGALHSGRPAADASARGPAGAGLTRLGRETKREGRLEWRTCRQCP